MALLERVEVENADGVTTLAQLPPGTRYVPDRPLTVDEFYELIDEDSPAELDEGAVVMPSPVNIQHEDAVGFLSGLLRLFVDTRGLGLVLGSRAKVRLGVRIAREPDICYVAKANRARVKQQEIDGPPELVVEVITSDKGRSEAWSKRPQYEAAGVPELWMLDIPLRRLHFLVLEDGIYREVVLSDAEIVVSQILPGFRVAVSILLSPVGEFPPQWPLVEEMLRQA